MRRWILILLLGSRSVLAAAAVDPATTEPTALLWRFPVGARLAGPPAAASRWITAATESGRLFALESGHHLPAWDFDVNGSIVAGPLLQGFRLFIVTGAGRVMAYDLRSGEPLWERPLPGIISVSPGLDGEHLLWVALDSGILVALATASGETVDALPFVGQPATAPIRCDDRIVLGTTDGRVLGLSRKGGRPVWERRCGDSAPAPAACDRDAVLLGCNRALYRIGLEKGRVKWRFRTGADVTARPIPHGRHIYFVSYDNHIYVLKRKNGHPERVVSASHRIDLDPIRSGNLLFVLPDTAGEIAVHRLPAAEPVGRIPLPDAIEGACTEPVVAGRGLLVIGCGGDSASLYLIRAPVSTLDLTNPFDSSP